MNQINACLGIIEQTCGDCTVIDNVIDARCPKDWRVTVFEREIFPNEYVELTVNNSTNKPIALDLVKMC